MISDNVLGHIAEKQVRHILTVIGVLKTQFLTAFWDHIRPPSVPIGFVPQKLGLIWWVPWECKNLGELNFHMENGLPEAQKLPNRYYHMSRSQENWSDFFFVHYWGCGRHFSGGDCSDLLKRGELLHLLFCLSLCKMSNLAP